MHKLRESQMLREIIYVALSAFIALLILLFYFRLYAADLNSPFRYASDAIGWLEQSRNFINRGINGYFNVPSMGSPVGASFASWPGGGYLYLTIAWLISLFSDSVGFVFNASYLSSFVIATITATISLRMLGRTPIISIMGGLVYSFLYYHIIRVGHTTLATNMSDIPFLCVLILWFMNGKLMSNDSSSYQASWFNRHKLIIVAIIMSIFVALSNTYYTFFSGLCFAFCGLYVIVNKDFKKLTAFIPVMASFMSFTFLGLLPHLLYRLQGGTSSVGGRSGQSVEIYSLRLVDLLLPSSGHIYKPFRIVRSLYDKYLSYISAESWSAGIGILMGIGFIISLFLVIKSIKNSDKIKNNLIYQDIYLASLMNVALLLLGSVGGVSGIIAMAYSGFRCFNRLIIIIAFLSLIVITYYFDIFLIRHRDTHKKMSICCIIIFSFALIDVAGNPLHLYNSSRDNSRWYYNDMKYFDSLNNTMTADSVILELPVIYSWNAYLPLNNMEEYELSIPMVHSSSLNWTYRPAPTVMGKNQEYKLKGIESLLSGDEIQEGLKHLAGKNINGILLNRNAYKESDFNNLITHIENITNVSPIIDENGVWIFYNLESTLGKLKDTLSSDELDYYGSWNTPQIFNQRTNFCDSLTNGWSGLEDWGVWTDGDYAKIEVNLPHSLVNNGGGIEFQYNAWFIRNDLNCDIIINGDSLGKLNTIPDPITGLSVISIPQSTVGKASNILTIEFLIHNAASPVELGWESTDTRKLGIGLQWFEIKEVEDNE